MIWVIDSADKRRLEDCKEELEKLLLEEKLAGASLLIFANKQDVKGALSLDQIKEALGLNINEIIQEKEQELQESSTNQPEKFGMIGKSRHFHVQSCSAVTGEGLLEGIKWIVDDISSRIFLLE